MAIFGKMDQLPNVLRKVQTNGPFVTGELEGLLVQICAHPEFDLLKNIWMASHLHPKVRECATKLFLARKDPVFAEPLIKEMFGKPPQTRQDIAKVVVEIGPDVLARQLSLLIHSTKPEHRAAAVDLIAQCAHWQEFLGHLKVALKDTSDPIRHAAVRVLTKGVTDSTIFLILRGLIHDDDASVRRLVIEVLAQEANADVVEPFFERLPLEGPEERGFMMKALTRLAKSGSSKIENHLMPFLADENMEVRDAALKLLIEMPDQVRVFRTLLIHCRGLVFWLRERTIQSILKACANLLDSLMELMKDPDEDIRVEAMMLASRTKDARIIPAVREIFLGQSDWWVRSMAAEILGTFPTPEIAKILISKVRDPELRYSIISVLGKQGTREAVPILLESLRDPQQGIRLVAIEALLKSKAPEAMQAISEVALNDSDEKVRTIAGEALVSFGAKSSVVRKKLEERRETIESTPITTAPVTLQMVNDSLNTPEPGSVSRAKAGR